MGFVITDKIFHPIKSRIRFCFAPPSGVDILQLELDDQKIRHWTFTACEIHGIASILLKYYIITYGHVFRY